MKKEVEVAEVPKCDVCGAKAVYDSKTIHGPWAYLCELHFRRLGIGLGVGKGQKLTKPI